LTIQLWHRRVELRLPAFYLIADPEFIKRRARVLGLDVALDVVKPAQASDAFARALPISPLDSPVTAAPGKPDASSAPAAVASIRRAVADVLAGQAAAIVTNPVAKPVMMLWSPELAVVPVTIHLPFRDVVSKLTSDLVVETARIVARDLTARFGISRPRIVVAGLNPHAGEQGALGEEDGKIVAPAVKQLQAEGIDVIGPLPADTLFHERARATYDVALCMYHDQALIPIKTLAFDHAVNVTLGLPFVRTSPDHGTAFDIAGQGIADPSSLLAALALAARLSATAPALVPAK
jgi:4-hydroxythreonine-4-phosphate dehydrogenase